MNEHVNHDLPEETEHANTPESTPEDTAGEKKGGNEELSETDKLKAENRELSDKYLRLYAEFDNFRRRSIKERSELLQSAGKDIILSLLPVIDDIERAKKAADMATDMNSIKEGLDLIYQKLFSNLETKGLKPIKAVGEPFNVDIHEAVTNVPVADESMKGKVIDEVEKGYMLNDKVIRFTKAIIGE